MTRHPTWIARCQFCGEYASGHGQAPPVEDDWVCGNCASYDLDCGMGQPVDLDAEVP